MRIKSTDGIYAAIEEALKGTKEPMTCADLMMNEKVREAAVERFGNDIQVATNKLSDTLGFMWRRDVLSRFSAPPSSSMSRFAYQLADQPAQKSKPVPSPSFRPVEKKPRVVVTEHEGTVTLDFESFTIVVTPK